MLHDDKFYVKPDEFDPDRFLPRGDSQPEPDPTRAAFGFGRRYDIPRLGLAER